MLKLLDISHIFFKKKKNPKIASGSCPEISINVLKIAR